MSLTILIPTKSRYHTLYETIFLCLKLKKLVQIIVLDSSEKILPKKIEELINSDKRIEYVNTPISFNAVENFNYGVGLIRGKYCIYIGDDDIVCSTVDDVISEMDINGIECCTSTFPANYQWPGYKTLSQKNRLSGSLVIRKYTGAVRIKHDLRSYIHDLVDLSFKGPQDLPRAYLGIVKTEILNNIIKNGLSVFGGVSPDIYSSVLIGWHAKNLAILDFPFIVPGASTQSTTALAASDNHRGNFYTNPHLSAFPGLVWSEKIPKIYLPETVWAYSYERALIDLDSGIQIKLGGLYKNLSFIDVDSMRELIVCELLNGRKFHELIIDLIYNIGRYIFRRAKGIMGTTGLRRLVQNQENISISINLMDSIIASNVLEEQIKGKKISFGTVK